MKNFYKNFINFIFLNKIYYINYYKLIFLKDLIKNIIFIYLLDII